MKQASIRDVAKAAGVSPATVSRAIKGTSRVAEETLELIRDAIRKTGYVLPDGAALEMTAAPLSSLGGVCQNSRPLVYLVIKNLSTNSYANLLAKTMVCAAEQRGVDVAVVNISTRDENGTGLEQHVRPILQRAVALHACGLVISGFLDSALCVETRGLLKSSNVPVVFINRHLSPYGFNRILTGGDRGAYIAAAHMIEAGRKNLLMIQLPGHTGKTQGFLQAIKELGEPNVRSAVETVSDDLAENSYQLILRYWKKDPSIDGILCCEDEIAAGVLRGLTELGVRVPQQVELIGYNDNLAGLLTPPISSVRVPMRDICESAFQLLFDERANGPAASAKTVLMDPQLILRG